MLNITEIGGEAPTNCAASKISDEVPYVATVAITGVADVLFHRWNVEAVDEKAKAAKGSKAKKTDDIESYVYRMDDGNLATGEYQRGAIIGAAKFRQDPRSPRKSAQDLVKAGIVSLTALADLGKPTWDYEHRARVLVQRQGVNRTRPALKAGWRAEFDMLVNLPEYIRPDLLHDLVSLAGKLIGIADFRPTYGRFQIVRFDVAAMG